MEFSYLMDAIGETEMQILGKSGQSSEDPPPQIGALILHYSGSALMLPYY